MQLVHQFLQDVVMFFSMIVAALEWMIFQKVAFKFAHFLSFIFFTIRKVFVEKKVEIAPGNLPKNDLI